MHSFSYARVLCFIISNLIFPHHITPHLSDHPSHATTHSVFSGWAILGRNNIHNQRIKPGTLACCIWIVRLAGVSEVVGYPVAGDDDEFDVLYEEGTEGFGPGEICE